MRRFKILIYIYCFLGCYSNAPGGDNSSNEVIGRVMNEQGLPLSGVEIRHYFNGSNSNTTDENGMFSLLINTDIDTDNCCVVTFLLSGYKRKTEVFKYGTNNITITMSSSENIWSPPLCNLISNKSDYLGWDLKVLLPKKAEIKKLPDSDNIRINIGFKSKLETEYQWMELGTGALWLPVVPYKNLLRSQDIKEREIKGGNYYYEYINDTGNVRDVREFIGVDYHGIDEHGKKWRDVSFRFQTITYKNVTPDAAEYFDKIIDSMCVDPERVINGKIRRLSGIQDIWK